MEETANEFQKDGRKPYVIPVGGSNVTGIMGYAACAEELTEQATELGVQFDYIICTRGSGG